MNQEDIENIIQKKFQVINHLGFFKYNTKLKINSKIRKFYGILEIFYQQDCSKVIQWSKGFACCQKLTICVLCIRMNTMASNLDYCEELRNLVFQAFFDSNFSIF